MKVSRRTEYGLRALVALAERAQPDAKPVSLREIAVGEDIPEAFLDQIFSVLRRDGIVQSIRGAGGGYLLARGADAIRMGQVVKTLEGSVAPMGCVSEEFASPADFCPKADRCHTRNVWQKLSDTIERTLDGISLADVMADEAAAESSAS